MSRYYGCLPKAHDSRDFLFRAPQPYAGAFVDLSAGFPEAPYDQGQLGSCVSQGTAAILDYARAKQGLAPIRRPARLFIYWEGRKIEGSPAGQDTGLQVRDGLAVVSKFGAPPEDTDWPYDISTFAHAPSAKAVADALLDEAVKFGAVQQGGIDAAIASGYPVVFGFEVFESFESQAVADTGVMPVPKPGERSLGGHCVVCVSTVEDGRNIPHGIPGVAYRRVRNSWGAGWGDGGYFWMPASIMDDPNASSDFWVLTGVSDPHGPTPPTPPVPPAPFPGALVAAVTALAGDPKVATFLGRAHIGVNLDVADHLKAILAAPRA